MTTPKYPYDPILFDADYYGQRARGGFGPEIAWDHPEQQHQLDAKLAVCESSGEFNSILFIGCAQGAEVKYFRNIGKDCWGVEVSKWAVENCYPDVRERVLIYDGFDLSRFQDQQFDIVASFDVLTLLPEAMLAKLTSEMRRVTKERIIFRTVTLKPGDTRQWHGTDGVTFRYLPREQWEELFNSDFALMSTEYISHQGFTFVFRRK